MTPRLGIVIPYRDRAAHLAEFIPYLSAFFSQDPLNRDIPCRFLIVEQAPGEAFNQGALQNIGFKYLESDIDYLCLHDVDVLPEQADYSWPYFPSMLILHGLPHPEEFTRTLLSGVVLLQKQHFLAANGFSNTYPGWGYEDVDLRERLLRCGLAHENRAGTYRRLPHVDCGSNPDGTPTEDSKINGQRFTERWFMPAGNGWRRLPVAEGWRAEGLNSLRFTELQPRRVVQPAAPGLPLFEHVVVAPQV